MKNIKLLILIFIMIFLNLVDATALSQTIGPITQPQNTHVMDNCGLSSCYGLSLKLAGSSPVICTKYDKTTPANSNITCTITNDWSAAVRYGVAAIIKEASGISSTEMTNEYFAAEMAINKFLAEKGVGGYDVNGEVLTSTYRGLYNTYLSKANTAYSNHSSDSNVNISLSTKNLTFSLSGNNYVSNSITVSGVSSYTVQTDVGTVSKSGILLLLLCLKSSIDKTTTVNVTVSSSKTISYARNYDCGTNYQTVTPIKLEAKELDDRESLSGTIVPKAKLVIEKVDSDGNYLSGATLKITGPNGFSKTIVSSNTGIILDDLELGTYTITEEKAPKGYDKSKKVIEIIVSDNGTITINGKPNTNGIIKITNDLTKTKISKVNVTNGKELPGATLQILAKDKKAISCTILQNGTEKKLNECKWISGEKEVEIIGLEKGDYYLKETMAPKGYTLSDKMVPFTVKGDGSVTKVKMENQLEVKVPDTLSARSALLLVVAMFDIALGIGILTYVKKNKVQE